MADKPSEPKSLSPTMRRNLLLLGGAVALVGATAYVTRQAMKPATEAQLSSTAPLSNLTPYQPIPSSQPVSLSYISPAEAEKAPQEKRTIGGIEYLQFENKFRQAGELETMYATTENSVKSFVLMNDKLQETETPIGFYVFSQVTNNGKPVRGMTLENALDRIETTKIGEYSYVTLSVNAEEAKRLSAMSVPDSTPYNLIRMEDGETVLETQGTKTVILGKVFRGRYISNIDYPTRNAATQPTSAPSSAPVSQPAKRGIGTEYVN